MNSMGVKSPLTVLQLSCQKINQVRFCFVGLRLTTRDVNSFHPLFHWTTGPQLSVGTTSTLIRTPSYSVWRFSVCIMYHEHAKLFNQLTSVGLLFLLLWLWTSLHRTSHATGSITLIWSVQTCVCIRSLILKRGSLGCPPNQREHFEPCPWRGVSNRREPKITPRARSHGFLSRSEHHCWVNPRRILF